jgi:SAM-dependent methyltransferase
MSAFRTIADRMPWLFAGYRLTQALYRDLGLNPLRWLDAATWFTRDYRCLVRQATASGGLRPSPRFLSPYLRDRTGLTPLEPVYFFQNTWAARKIAQFACTEHVDVGSSANAMAVIAQFVPVTMVDIRPLGLKVERLTFREGSVMKLPFANGSVKCLTSLCVIEHIGLGRYGDGLDALGDEKALAELRRVLHPAGNLLISLPVDRESRIYFNAHRAYTRDHLRRLFTSLDIVEECYQYGDAVYSSYDPEKGFGTGMFHLRKKLA